MQVICPYCGKPAVWEDKKILYGKLFGQSRKVWICHPCNAWVGCHRQNGKKSLGSLANGELRIWRTRTHEIMDNIWKKGEMQRQDFYAMLSRQFKREIHVAQADVQTCKEIIEFAKAFINWDK